MSKKELAEGLHMIVEEEEYDLLITLGRDFTPHYKVLVIQYLVDNLSKMSGIQYNEILDDLKVIDEPIAEANKAKKKKKERK
jgi:hypothetical protein